MNAIRDQRSARRPAVIGLAGALIASMLVSGIAQASTYTMNIEHYVFSPSPLTIVAGTTVKWVNKDPTQHQIVSDTGAFASSKLLDTGQSYAVKFSKAGTFNYHDGFNAFIKGTIIVTGVPKATPKPTPKPTAKPTPKPTAKATAAATTAPTATAAASTDTAAASPVPSDGSGAVTASPGTDATAAPGGSTNGSTDGSTSGSSGGSLDIGSILVGLVLAVLLFFAWIGLQSFRRNQPGPPTSGGSAGGGSGGGSAGGGSAGGGSAGGGGSSAPGGGSDGGGSSTEPPDATTHATTHATAHPVGLAPSATSAAPASVSAPDAPEPPATPMSPASRRLVRRTGPVETFDEDAPIGSG